MAQLNAAKFCTITPQPTRSSSNNNEAERQRKWWAEGENGVHSVKPKGKCMFRSARKKIYMRFQEQFAFQRWCRRFGLITFYDFIKTRT